MLRFDVVKKPLTPHFTIFLFSDPHMMYRRMTLAKADYYFCTGDVCVQGNSDELELFNDFATDVIAKKMCQKLFLVPGNHDGLIQDSPEEAKAILNKVELLVDKSISINGMKAHGSPWSPTYKNWSFMDSDLNLGRYWNKIPDDTELLFTHCPPMGILDRVDDFPYNVGSKTLRQKVDSLSNLKLHCFGHIHPSYGTYSKNGVLYINSAIPVVDHNLAIMNSLNPAYLLTISPETKRIIHIEQVF